MDKKEITLFGYAIQDILSLKHLEKFKNYMNESIKDEEEFPYIRDFYPLSTDNSIFEIVRFDESLNSQCNLTTEFTDHTLAIFPIDDWKDVIITDIRIKIGFSKDKELRIINYKGLILLTDMFSVYGCLTTLYYYAISINNCNMCITNGILTNKEHVRSVKTAECRIYPLTNILCRHNDFEYISNIIECKNGSNVKITLHFLFSVLPNQKLIDLVIQKTITSIKSCMGNYGNVCYSDYLSITINDDIVIYIPSITNIFLFEEDFIKLIKLFK